MDLKIDKSQTGIASEFYVAGELGRLGYNVTLTFGNTKSIDLLVQKEDKIFPIQVKGIQTNRSICWNLDKTKITDNLYFVLVNLHIDLPKEKPEFFILTATEAKQLFRDTNKAGEKRTYLDYNRIKKLNIYQNRWDVFGKSEYIEDEQELWQDFSAQNFLKGYGENDPEYTMADVKEPNPEYKHGKENNSDSVSTG